MTKKRSQAKCALTRPSQHRESVVKPQSQVQVVVQAMAHTVHATPGKSVRVSVQLLHASPGGHMLRLLEERSSFTHS